MKVGMDRDTRTVSRNSGRKSLGNARMPTYVPPVKSMPTKWHVIDANGKVLGRVATDAAKLLQGKHKAIYTPYLDTGDHVVILNVAKVKLTGRKEEQKVYQRHSGYPGGLREDRAKVVRTAKPERMMEEAVRGMLPKSKLGDAMYRKLKVYAGDKHPHTAQSPTVFEVA
jgi:large subunit ribosomal protein L13